MSSAKKLPIDLEALVQNGKVDTVITAFVDPYGRLMGKRSPARYFLEQLQTGKIHACDYLLTCDMELEPLPGFEFSSWDSGYGDMAMQPDLSTLCQIPWMPATALVLCDLFRTDGSPAEPSPRRILQRQLAACKELGFVPQMASELEFFLFQGNYQEQAERGFAKLQPTTSYLIDYHILGTSKDEELLRDIRNLMPLAGIPVESSKGEWGRGQHEVNLVYTDALTMADKHVIFKDGVKLLAEKHGRSATFMAKVAHEMAGSSCHIHLSLQDLDGHNLFWDPQNEQPSALFESFLAGCMHHAAHLSIFFAPQVNSYKRYRAASFAPTAIAWDTDNRTCGFRVVGHGASLRIENRMPGADVNPYLAFAATLAAGLDGVAQKRPLAERVVGNAYQTEGVEKAPSTLYQALQCLSAGTLAQEAFGADVVAHYRKLAENEQAFFDNIVTNAERARYFERI